MSEPLPTLVTINHKIDDLIDDMRNLIAVVKELRDGKAKHPAGDKPNPPKTDVSAVINLEQPNFLCDDPGAIVLQFSKHRGKRIDQLEDGMLIWLLKTWKPKEAPSGGWYASDAELWSAIRHFWHERQGTLTQTKKLANDPEQIPPETEDIPF